MSITDVCLRFVEDADLAFLRELYASTRQAELEHILWDQAAKDAFLTQQFNAQRIYYRTHYPDAEYWIIEESGRAVGRTYLFWTPTHLQIIDLSLLPEACGRGIGTGLLERLLKRADQTGLSVGLHVEYYNPAQRLYQRHGFEAISENGVYLKMHRRAQPFHIRGSISLPISCRTE